MKQETLIKGKWYKLKPYASDANFWYIKYKEKNGGMNTCTEYISNNHSYSKAIGYFNIDYGVPYSEVQISEIKHLLPKYHPDLKLIKQKEFLIY